jgi:DNA polymerase III alpha subunit
MRLLTNVLGTTRTIRLKNANTMDMMRRGPHDGIVQGNREGYGVAESPGFVHLHVHSSYSLLEGALTIARLAELAKKDRQPALALTDTDNMFGVLEFSEKMAGSGIQPIVGCALAIDFADEQRDPRNPGLHRKLPRLVLLAASEEGYRSLSRRNGRHHRAHRRSGWRARSRACCRPE